MKIKPIAPAILTAVALAIVGCDAQEPDPKGPPKAEGHSSSKQGPASPPPLVEPSPVPQLPDPSDTGTKSAEGKDAPKPDKKDEPPK